MSALVAQSVACYWKRDTNVADVRHFSLITKPVIVDYISVRSVSWGQEPLLHITVVMVTMRT